MFTDALSPREPTSTRQWQARTGDVVTAKIEFQPVEGSTMASLASGDRPERSEPLENAELFSAVSRTPPPQRSRLLDALWQVANGCPDCGGNAQKELYGVAIDKSTAAYSGCGWYMNGAWLNCSGSDALAVWDQKRGGFYFATDMHRENGVHDDPATLLFSPAFEDWPMEARDRFETWRNGRPWPFGNRQ
jgi:hypothetical protein